MPTLLLDLADAGTDSPEKVGDRKGWGVLTIERSRSDHRNHEKIWIWPSQELPDWTTKTLTQDELSLKIWILTARDGEKPGIEMVEMVLPSGCLTWAIENHPPDIQYHSMMDSCWFSYEDIWRMGVAEFLLFLLVKCHNKSPRHSCFSAKRPGGTMMSSSFTWRQRSRRVPWVRTWRHQLV